MLRVGDDARLDSVVFGLKLVERETRNRINRETRASLKPIWTTELDKQLAGTRTFTSRLLAGRRVAAGNPPVLYAATSRRGVGKSKRLNPNDDSYLAEFGGYSTRYSRYQRRSPNGGSHTVERRTMLGLPPRINRGRVVYPAAAETAPRLASLWVQTFVRSIYEAVEE